MNPSSDSPPAVADSSAPLADSSAPPADNSAPPAGSFDPPPAAVSQAVATALAEDLGPLGDLTSALIDPGQTAHAKIISHSEGILAGTACAQETFRQVDQSTRCVWQARDGDRLSVGQTLAQVSGSLASICTAERVALNFLSHLSGIASHTRKFADRARAEWAQAERPQPERPRTELAVLDTRKTTPGLRSLEKAAVRAGGGTNHRLNLSEWIMLKDNHLSALEIPEAVAQARRSWPDRKVQVECDTPQQAQQAMQAQADAILLDNMTPQDVAQVVSLVRQPQSDPRQSDPRQTDPARVPYLEVSGGITLENIDDYLNLDIDAISCGSLIGAARALDIGLDVTSSDPDAAALAATPDAAASDTAVTQPS